MRFVVLTALRETRAAWKRLAFFFACIAIGVGAIVAIRSVIQSIRGVLSGEARTLIASDILLTTDRPWADGAEQSIAAIAGRYTGVTIADAAELPTIARPADESSTALKLVELRAVPASFPWYGELTLQDGRRYEHALLEHNGALVRPELLAQLNVGVGAHILIGKARFEIRGVIASEPGRSLSAISLGPRVLIDLADLPGTGLLSFGSRVVRQKLIKAPEPSVDLLARSLTEALREQFVRVRSFKDRQEQVGEDFGRAENYLSLVGLVIVVLGGIAVSSVTRVFVRQKIRSIAVMKCLGGTSSQILSVYLLQATALGLLGSVCGVGLAAVAIAAIPSDFDQIGTLTVRYSLTWPAVLQGTAVGLLVSLLFAVIPLLEVRRIKPSLLLRYEMTAKGRDWLQVGAAVLVGGALVAIASWQAESWRVGASVCAGFVGLTLVLLALGWVLTKATAPLTASRWFPLRHAALHLARPGNQTRVILLTVGLGTFFIMGVRGLQNNLLDQFALEIGDQAPDLFLLDIQPDQAGGVQRLLDEHVGTHPQLIPVLRARVTGRGGSLDDMEDLRGRGMLSREYVLTYRDRLERNESMVSGQFPQEGEVSVEEGFGKRAGIRLGDYVRFDILGRTINARVSGIRKVNWRDGRNGGFMFVFGPRTFDAAPHYFIGPVRMGTDDSGARARLEHDVVAAFSNVSVIDLREVLQTVSRIFNVVSVAIRVVGTLVIVTGGLILIGAVAVTKFQRVYEAAVFKTLGATSQSIALMLLLEYGLLGTLAGGIGSAGAIALGWGVARYALDIPWSPSYAQNIISTIATSVVVAIVGVAASADVLRRKPLATLRAE